MKTKMIRLVLSFASLLVLASCDIYTGPRGEVVAAKFKGLRYGTFGGGTGRSYRPIGGTVIAGGTIEVGLCSPNGPYIRGGGGFRPLPNQWGQVNPYGSYRAEPYPYGSPQSPGYPSNYHCDPNLDRYRRRFPGPPCPGVLGPDGRWY